MRPHNDTDDETFGAALLATIGYVATLALVYLCALLLAR